MTIVSRGGSNVINVAAKSYPVTFMNTKQKNVKRFKSWKRRRWKPRLERMGLGRLRWSAMSAVLVDRQMTNKVESAIAKRLIHASHLSSESSRR